MNKAKELKNYKIQLKELLKNENIKIKSIIKLSNDEGYRVFIKYKDIDLFKLNLLKRDISKIFNLNDIKFKVLDDKNLTLSVYKDKEYLNYEPVELNEYELLLGYNQQGYIIANMKKQVNLLIAGLPGQGKSRMVNYMLKNLQDKVDILVLNGVKEDYEGFTVITDIKAIERRIQAILEVKEVRKKPLYLVIEEMQVLSKYKKIQELLKELLSTCRKYRVICIGIIQIATKDNCSFKDLFNCRLTFKQVETSAYSVCLGVSIEKGLNQREFYLLSDDIVRGYTFNN